MVGMPVLGKTVGYTIRGVRGTFRWVGRRVHGLRSHGGGGEVGMIRLLDLHAVSCAGDTLVTMGLAGTIFFNVPAGEARGKVALYLLITMAPFALLAPLIGPLLDRFRHGRRYALAATMLGRAFLAWLISDYLHQFGLYPAAFGVLALSRAYGVARSAAVPRLLPAGLGLSEAGARASVFGTLAGAVVAPIGIAAFYVGPQWPLRIASVIFLIGMVIALRLPAPADSAPPETVPRVFTLAGRSTRKVLSGRVVTATVVGASALRLLFGFLTLFLAFAVREGGLPRDIIGLRFSPAAAFGVVAGALGVGGLLATAVGTRLRIRRPVQLQAVGMVAVTVTALIATLRYSLATVALFCLVTAVASGLAKLAADATIQERVPEEVRASAFAHSETLLMMAFVVGGGIGLIPFAGHWGIAVATLMSLALTVRAVLLAAALSRERLTGSAAPAADAPAGATATGDATTVAAQPTGGSSAAATRVLPDKPERGRGWRRGRSAREEFAERTRRAGDARPGETGATRPGETKHVETTVIERTEDDLPTYHLYRPSGTQPGAPGDEPGR